MIRTGLFDHDHLDALKRAVDVYARRHQVTAENIANVETPGYRAQRVKFEELLAQDGMKLRGAVTQQGHLPVGRRDPWETEGETVESASGFDNGVNNVDIDGEMTDLATTDLSYRMATRLLSMRYSMLRGAIKGRIG